MGEHPDRESVSLDTSENTGDMENIAVKDIPQEKLIKNSLKDELLGEHNLKHTEAAEKIVLPTAEDVKLEKNHQNILSGILIIFQLKNLIIRHICPRH